MAGTLKDVCKNLENYLLRLQSFHMLFNLDNERRITNSPQFDKPAIIVKGGGDLPVFFIEHPQIIIGAWVIRVHGKSPV